MQNQDNQGSRNFLTRAIDVMRAKASHLCERIAHACYKRDILSAACAFLSFSNVIFPNASRCLTLAAFRKKQGKLEAAQAALLTARDLFGDQAPAELVNELVIMLIAKGAYYQEIAEGAYHQASSEMEKFLEQLPSKYSLTYQLGSILSSKRNFKEAQRHFSKDVPVTTGNGNVTFTRIVNFSWLAKEPGQLDCAPKYTNFSKAHNPAWEAIYFVAADPIYFCRFALPLVSSLKKNGKVNILIHFHIVNCDAAAEALISEIVNTEDWVEFSTETTDLSRLSSEQKKVYYSCARYLYAQQLLDAYELPLIVADIDQMVIAPLNPFLSFAKFHDVSLLFFGSQQNNILSLISATLVSLKPNKNGRDFSRAVSYYIQNALERPENLLWHLDQAALASCFLNLAYINYGFIPHEMFHLTADDPRKGQSSNMSIFWSITASICQNDEKIKSESFQTLVGK